MDLKSEVDLSGKVIIKVQLGDDIRRIPIHNDAITYDELVLMMQRIFNGKVSASDEITIKYKDEDGDLITINDSSDIFFAIQCSRVLKLIILMHSSEALPETKSTLKYSEISDLKTQLRSIRDQVNKLLDTLDVPVVPVMNIVEENSKTNPGGDIPSSKDTLVSKVNPSEFDPLQNTKLADIQKDVPINNHEVPEPHPHIPPIAPVSVSNQTTQHVPDYYARPSPTGYPQVSYGNVGYAQQQYPYSSAGGFIPPTDHTQVPQSSNVYVNNSQQYPTPPQQQTYNAPSTSYPTQGQGNPYSKSYNQPAQHIYNPPR